MASWGAVALPGRFSRLWVMTIPNITSRPGQALLVHTTLTPASDPRADAQTTHSYNLCLGLGDGGERERVIIEFKQTGCFTYSIYLVPHLP